MIVINNKNIFNRLMENLKIKYNKFIKIFLIFLMISIIIYIRYNIILLIMKNKFRVLIYTCCDEKYSHYIPIFINTMLKSDKLKRLDFEIGVNINKLSNNEEKAIKYLRKKYYYSNIIIKYNFFIKNSTGTYYNNIKMETWSVRFVSKPILKNKYVYITDIDIITLADNFYLNLINDMNKRRSCYSNMVRMIHNPKRLTGLHFFEYNSYYPIPKQNNYSMNDEELLYKIVKSKGIKIDYNTIYRPLFGFHISPHSPDGSKYGGKEYILNWIDYCKSSDYKHIYPLLDKFVLDKIYLLNKIYNITECKNINI